METAILSPLIVQFIPGSDGRFVRHTAPFRFQSKVLYDLGLEYIREAPVGFVQDLESIPWFRGSCPEGGSIHDLVCREDFDPRVTKKVAADIYMEFMRYAYSLDEKGGIKGKIEQIQDTSLEYLKYGAVLIWPGYFHKHNVSATYEEMNA